MIQIINFKESKENGSILLHVMQHLQFGWNADPRSCERLLPQQLTSLLQGVGGGSDPDPIALQGLLPEEKVLRSQSDEDSLESDE